MPRVAFGSVAPRVAFGPTPRVALGSTAPRVALGSAPRVRLGVRFTPYRLGGQTTIVYHLQIAAPDGGLPPSVTAIDLRLPQGVGLATSTLGLTNCETSTLIDSGPGACPSGALVGRGSALIAIPTERGVVREKAGVQALSGPPQNENFVVLFYVHGDSPLLTQLVFAGELLSDSYPYSSRLNTVTPPIPTWPGGPYAVLTSFSSTIGPLGLTYYERRRGKLVPYHPRGIVIPARCPRGGFVFAADLSFADGSHVSARRAVGCPRGRG